MKYISLFSGIGGFDLGFDRAGMECILQVEMDKYARSVLETHWRDVPKMEDVRNVTKESVTGTVDLICGGFPCQDVSVAGNRAGLAGNRSGLWFEFRRIISEIRPQWVVIENVPGLLSSNNGRDFAVVLRGLVECGYGVAYRILDSQYFGVPQRRRRVFIVGHLGTGRAGNVLFESEGVSGDIEAGRKTGQGTPPNVAGTLSASGAGTARTGNARNEADMLVYRMQAFGQYQTSQQASTIKTQDYKDATDLVATSIDTRNHTINGEISGTLQAKPNGGYSLNYINPVAFVHNAGVCAGIASGNTSPTLRANASKGSQSNAVTTGYGVRRLTPMECERLQGFPDGHTAQCSDAQRYKQLGNAVTVNVAEWIGKRIMEARWNAAVEGDRE